MTKPSLFAFLVLAALLPSTAWCQAPIYITGWGTYGAGQGQFRTPVGVAADAEGNVFVVETGGNRVQRFTAAGMFIAEWHVTLPAAVAVDAAGFVYVSADHDSILKFTNTGTPLAAWGMPGAWTTGLAVDRDGNVYVADPNGERIIKFTNTGIFLTQWGGSGSGDGQFSGPEGVAVHRNGRVFVLETWNARVQKFTVDGAFLAKWGGWGRADGQFDEPTRVAVDNNGTVYVADYGNNRIQMFTDAGTYVGQWGTPGSGPGQFLSPVGVAVDETGYVYVADTNNNRIQVFAPGAVPTRGITWGHLKTLYR